MLERFKRYFAKLERMSCNELDRSAAKLVRAEKQSSAKLIAHIAEMSRRKAALELGYKHLYDYCLTRLRLSEGSIPLRIQVANAARRHPANTTAEGETYRPARAAGGLQLPLRRRQELQRKARAPRRSARRRECPEAHGGDFEASARRGARKEDPKRKHERRQAREAAKASPSPDEMATAEPVGSRYVVAATRGRVLARAGYQCEYRARDGTRCTSRTGLQIEHVRPFAIYQSHDERYLREFCPAHNRLAAERVYGSEFIHRKIQHRITHGAV